MRRCLLWPVLLAGLMALGARGDAFEAVDAPLKLKGATGQTAQWLAAFVAGEPARFGYTVEPAAPAAQPDAETPQALGYRLYRVTFPSPMKTPYVENNSVPAELYLPLGVKAGTRVPGAIVLDILDGRAIVPRIMARALAVRGVATLYFPMPYYNGRRPEGLSRRDLWRKVDEDASNVLSPLRQTVMDVRRAKALLTTRPEIDPQRIGVTGVSLGGIMASLAAGVDGDFYRVAPVIAGGDLASLVFHAREMRQVKAMLEERGIGRAELAKLLEPVEPLNFASRIDPKTCLMINASEDEVIPRAATLALRKVIGDPTILWMPSGHYSSALFLPNTEQKVADFMLGREVTTLDFDRRK